LLVIVISDKLSDYKSIFNLPAVQPSKLKQYQLRLCVIAV